MSSSSNIGNNKPPHRLDTGVSTTTTLSSTASSSASTSFNDDNEKITILGFGSLLSPTSAKTTFPTLTSFRLGRVPNHRRVFGHPASIFFQRGIADMETLEISSLCAEYCESESFVCSIFEVPNDGMMIMDEGGDDDEGDNMVPSQAFLEREEEFDIVVVPYEEIEKEDTPEKENDFSDTKNTKKGILCRKSTDQAYLNRWGQDHFHQNYEKYGIDSIWGWDDSSGIRPCGPYLRHCVLAAQKMGGTCYDSFLDETFLVDRKTTIREYLKEYPEVMDRMPPAHLAERYGG